MKKNICPHCGNKITTWKKWQLTDNRYGKSCPECGKTMVLPKWFVKFTYAFNLIGVLAIFLATREMADNRTLILLLGAAVLIGINLLVLQSVEIRRPE